MRPSDLRPIGLLGALPAAIAACGDSSGEDTSFRITSVAFDNDSTITLTFSRPVADIAGVDPNDFRVDVAETSRVTYTYANGSSKTDEITYYQDPTVVVLDYEYYTAGDFPFTFMSIEPGSSANQIILRTTATLGPGACLYLQQTAAHFKTLDDDESVEAQYDVALFLHYAAGANPIESDDGMVLGDIGADWVLNKTDPYTYRESYGFTMLKPQVRIPCP